MFCCCSRDSSYVVEESEQKPPAANIQTGKGALSTSSQSIPTEAELEKGTITETKRERTPVPDHRPTSQVQQPPVSGTHDKGDVAAVKPSSAEANKSEGNLEVSSQHKEEVSETLVSPESVKLNLAVQDQTPGVPESSVKAVSVINVVKPTPGGQSLPSNLESQTKSFGLMYTDLEKLERAIGEVEAKPTREAKKSVPELANQLKALNSQVLAAARGPAAMSDPGLQTVVSRLEAVTSRLELLASQSSSGGSAAGDADAVAPFVEAFDQDILSDPLAKFVSLSNEIGGDVKNQALVVQEVFNAQRSFLVVVSKSKQPDQNTLVELLGASASKLQQVQDIRENNRKSEYFNHLSAISESIAALGWVGVTPAPSGYVKEMADAGTFYTNRVLKDYKEKDPRHVEWCRAWIRTLTTLASYIKSFHTTGLSWNPKGGDAKTVQVSGGGGAAPPPAPAGGPPPPPPPGPPPPPMMSAPKDDGPDKSALFAELNKGTAVTQGLRKVTDDMKTHKNPALREGAAPFKPNPTAKPIACPKPVTKVVAIDKPPVFELQGKKWIIEHQKNNKNLVVENVELRQSVYAYKCENSTIQIKGKINSVTLDSCKKTAIVFEDLLASLEFVNCQSMQAQVTGKLPTVSIDKTDGCMVYLSSESLNVEIVTAKSSEINILVPQGDGDFKEFALPEQFKTVYNGKIMVTTATDLV